MNFCKIERSEFTCVDSSNIAYNKSSNDKLYAQITNLTAYTQYNCSVRVGTRMAVSLLYSPFSEIRTFQTKEGGKSEMFPK